MNTIRKFWAKIWEVLTLELHPGCVPGSSNFMSHEAPVESALDSNADHYCGSVELVEGFTETAYGELTSFYCDNDFGHN